VLIQITITVYYYHFLKTLTLFLTFLLIYYLKSIIRHLLFKEKRKHTANNCSYMLGWIIKMNSLSLFLQRHR
jgi:hypothetical protein